jgi:hypothetical protein
MRDTDLHSLVCLCVVLVVLDPPGLEGVDEGHEGQGAYNVLKQLVGAEAAVTTVVANNKELQGQGTSTGCSVCAACHKHHRDSMHRMCGAPTQHCSTTNAAPHTQHEQERRRSILLLKKHLVH